MDLKSVIRAIPDWPQPGIVFRDIGPLLQNPTAFRHVCDAFYHRYRGRGIDKVIGIDARGFPFAAVLAFRLDCGLVMSRKGGKLPGVTERREYALEYGHAALEMAADALSPGERVVVVDDLLATGGTAKATVDLVTAQGATVDECAFVIELVELSGRPRLAPVAVFSLVNFS